MLKPGDTIQCPITGERLVIRAHGAQPRDDSPAKRILVATMPFPGHVRPGLAIVRELTGRGHEVSWYTGRAFESAVQRAGATFVPIPSHLEPGSELWATTAKGQPASGLRKLRWDIRHGFLGTVPAYLRHLRNVFDDTQPDVVVAEQGFVAAPLLAEQRDIPRVIFTVTPLSLSSEDTAPFGTGLPPATTALGRLRNRALNGLLRNLVFRDSQRFAAGLRSDLGLAPLDGSFLDWGANIADRYLHATIPEFEYPRVDLPDNVEFIGALLPTDVDVWSRRPGGTTSRKRTAQDTVLSSSHRARSPPIRGTSCCRRSGRSRRTTSCSSRRPAGPIPTSFCRAHSGPGT
jgi:UDP:flavonoid glycosyltransferase YjiC (YdhE family)